MTSVRLEVDGLPTPAGSKTGIPIKGKGGKVRVAIVDGGSTAARETRRSWRADVVAAVERARERGELAHTKLDGPLYLEVTAWLPRPKSKPARVRYPDVTPDLSKLIRAIEDALTAAGVWVDDARIVTAVTAKRYATDRPGVHAGRAGATIAVHPID
jgi:Holliday junction resolvase RusA-like endonuclease